MWYYYRILTLDLNGYYEWACVRNALLDGTYLRVSIAAKIRWPEARALEYIPHLKHAKVFSLN